MNRTANIFTLIKWRIPLILTICTLIAGCSGSDKLNPEDLVQTPAEDPTTVTDNTTDNTENSTDSSETPDDTSGEPNNTDPAINTPGDTTSTPTEEFVVIKPDVPIAQQKPINDIDALPYRTNSQYADVLKTCYQVQSDNACSLDVLPLIGQTASKPGVEDIMNRVVVTHDWMGIRFEQILSRYSEDELRLFKPAAIIFLGSSIKSSGYSAGTAALKIGPSMMWLTANEKAAEASTVTNSDVSATIITRNALPFRAGFYYLKNNKQVDYTTEKNEREFDDMVVQFSNQLYRRLAFAANRVNPAVYSSPNGGATPYDLFNASAPGYFVEQLHNDNTLTNKSSFIYGLASVYYDGVTATNDQSAFTSESVGNQFALEGKINLFSYTSSMADAQRLFASGMMQYKYGITTDVFIYTDSENSNNRTITFGETNRLASPNVAPRAKYVMEKILGSSIALDQFFNSGLGDATQIVPGTTLDEYLLSIN